MAGVESKKKSLLSRSVGLLRRVGDAVLLGVVFVAFFVLCVHAEWLCERLAVLTTQRLTVTRQATSGYS